MNQFKNPKSENESTIAPDKVSTKIPFSLFHIRLQVKKIIDNELFVKITGLAFILLAFYLVIAFISFIFTWETDQDKVLGPLTSFLLSDAKASNWLGKTGAIVSHQFIHQSFGVASFIFVFIFLSAGLKILFKPTFFSLKTILKRAFFFLIWLSVTLGYLFNSSFVFLGGGFGYRVNYWLNTLLGNAGTGGLLLFIILSFIVLTFNPSFLWFKPKDKHEGDANIPLTKDKPIDKPILSNTFKPTKIETEKTPHEVEFNIDDSSLQDNAIEEEVEDEDEELDIDADIPFTVEVTENKEPEPIIEAPSTKELLPFGEYDPTLELSSYQFPTLDLLEQYGNKEVNVNTEELTANKNRIVATLGNYGIEIEKIKATIGPTVTLYEIVPAAGVRISKIKNLEDDIALSLSALGIRIIAPIPGKGTIGIEVPNQNPETVAMRSILASEKFQNTTMDLPIGLGKTISNETFIADLSKMPHLLMAGATGQGKSVGLNAVLVSLLYKKHPSQIKFVLVDPKKVELTLFNKIERHFLAKLPDSAEAIITDTKKVIHTLNSLCIEMDQRYDLLKDAQVRNIKEYNAKFIARKLNPNNGHGFLPYIVLVVDEFADLIMTAGKEVETPIARLAQLARAIGIHLIIATQRPSVNIITGTIKANFPARIAFRVTSKIDSRTILDSGGADQLIGRGDMLLSTGNDLIRIQCAFVDTHEVEKITEFIGSQRGYPEAFQLPEYVDESGEGNKMDLDIADRDSFFEEAARIIVQHQQGSASLLQRKLKLGYNRAGRIVDQLEAAGIIGPFEGSKAREVLIKDAMSLEQLLNNN